MDAIMNATIGQLVGGGLGIIAALSIFIEIVPVKLNPISSLLNWIGERTNLGISKRVDELEEKVDSIMAEYKKLDERSAENEAVHCRIRILRFSDELRRNIDHSQDSFEQVISDIDNYEKYCETHPGFQNNKTVVAKKRILDSYEVRLEQNDFL